jgi:hypothetical protein
MNSEIRWRGAGWGVGVTIAASVAIAPRAILDLLSEGNFTEKLWWSVLVGAFVIVALIVEGLGLGRKTKHRATLDAKIVNSVMSEVCRLPDCPQVENATPTAIRSVMGIFFAKIDASSREVAFYYWGWYYTALLWLWQSGIALAFAMIGVIRFPTDAVGLRILAILVLLASLLIAWLIRGNFARKTLDHAEQQLMQISGTLGHRLPNADCPAAACPCT